MELRLDTQVQFLKGVGPKYGELLVQKGIATVADLLEWYPRTYEDRRAVRSIASLKPNEMVSLKAQVLKVSSFHMGRSRRKIYDITLRDSTGKVHCKYFRVPYKGYFERFQPNQQVRVIGKVTYYRGQIEFHHPDIQDAAEEQEESNRLIPIYPESEGITNRQLRKMIEQVLERLTTSPGSPTPPSKSAAGGRVPLKKDFKPTPPPPVERLPQWVREKFSLIDRLQALRELHQPPLDAGEAWLQSKSAAHRRLIFEEFFWLELSLAAKRHGIKKADAPALKPATELVHKFEQTLPFTLTGAQKRCLQEITRDLGQPHPMHRLVQGDVGSGKTVVALIAALHAKFNGLQTALMAPTEILAEQHLQNARRLLEPLGLKVGYLVGSQKTAERNEILQYLQAGAIDLCVGTHALIQDEVAFHKLGLVIIDEQHRFGVQQRNLLKKKGLSPHFLVMTATPIPRTLAMTVYGDLDVSIIDELPKGRTPITTRVVSENKRPQVTKFVAEQIAKGRQAYVVYPLVEESEKVDLKDALSAQALWQQALPGAKVGLLHGKMKAEEKDAVMRDFRAGRVQVLVSTTVIEVGVDVPNSTLMLIEHAERFGLSQLHQLRGRVGRGSHKSYCILMLGYAVSEEARTRTQIMETTSDGFKISEADLEIRGPGEFLGTRQSGLPGFKLANLVRDVQILQEARKAAFELFARDAQLRESDHQLLRDELLREQSRTHLATVG